MRQILVCLAIPLCACAALSSAPTKTQKNKTPVEAEGEETGIKSIARLLREFNRALGDKQFDAATTLLGKADKAVSTASEMTRSHPDYEDIEASVRESRTRLDAAIEADRIARRNAAIDDSIKRGEAALTAGVLLYNELRARVPTEEDLEALTQAVAAIAKLRADGRQYEDEQRYRTHAADLDPKLAALDTRRRQAAWQRKASELASEPIEEAYEAAQLIDDAKSPQEAILGFGRITAGFGRCVGALTGLQTDADYRDDWLIETRLGVRTVAETKRLCAERGAKAKRESDAREWQEQVQTVVATMAPVVQKARSAKRAAEALSAAQVAVDALRKCQGTLGALLRHPGNNPSLSFQTLLGKHTAASLKEACGAEEGRFVKVQPSLRWALGLDAVATKLDDLKTRIAQAEVSQDLAARVELWRAIVTGYAECSETAKRVAQEPAADASLVINTALGALNVKALEKECDRQQRDAQEHQAAAAAKLELAKFVATCRGEEIAVAEREGIPARVETVTGGRVFIYEQGKGKTAIITRFGFDPNGKRVDFRMRWLESINALVSELDRLHSAVRAAATGKEALKATEGLLPVLAVCIETLDQTEKHPGYDATTTFATALGKLAAPRLREACVNEKAKRAQSLVALQWRTKVEELRDRMAQADEDLDKARLDGPPEPRLQLLATALGGYTECVERAEALATTVGNDKNLKVKTAAGDVNLAALKKACSNGLAASHKEREQVERQKALDQFVGTCRADETEVARREGVPARIEKRAGGRVFVYDVKGKSKRFAFTAEGKRTDEKNLGELQPEPPSSPRR